MKTALLIILTLCIYNLQAQFSLADFKRLHAMEGIWELKEANNITMETWKVKNDSTMNGSSYKINNKDTNLLETVTLAFKKGMITYTPVTSDQNNQQPVVFTLAGILENSFSFVNREHDFPQVIIYNLQSETRLVASISGPSAEGEKTIEYPYEKQKK